jgi:hypothetical protein
MRRSRLNRSKRSQETLLMRDIVDSQIRTLDGWRVGRATDVEAERRSDGALVVRCVVLGPEAHAGRLGRHVWSLVHRVLKGRFEHGIPVGDIEELGLNIQLSRPRDDYEVGSADRWIVEHILRFIPGHDR